MNEQDKNYIETHKAWVESTSLNIKEHELEVEHNHQKIALLNAQIELDSKRAQLSINYLNSGVEAFNEWCRNNNIDPETV